MAAAGGRNDAQDDQEDWERRLADGDLPEDFLAVTEPKANSTAGRMAASNQAFEPEVGQLVDVPVAGPQGAAPEPPSKRSPKRESEREKKKEAPSPKSTSAERMMSMEDQDHAMAMALQEQLNMEGSEPRSAVADGSAVMMPHGLMTATTAPANMIGRLTISVVEARLAKNYGLSRMDPYCRLRVGHTVYETPTCPNGSKEPKWNKTFQCYLLQGIKNIDVEVYDECTFSADPLIAHGMFPIPEEVIKGHEVVDDWFPLSGNEGDGKEGTLHLILSLQPILPGQPLAAGPQVRVAPNLAAGHKPMAYQTAYLSPQRRPHQEQHQPPPLKPLSDEEIDEFLKMFPNLDREIIISVHVACNGNKDSMVNSLLQLGQQ